MGCFSVFRCLVTKGKIPTIVYLRSGMICITMSSMTVYVCPPMGNQA
ncbi:hypothetical protein CASFOL_003314 [Castilleja foliolosa]|uniref:Uncharacterized protein n=1 Tax=Castilleja foliolosa TaxID=1961234 RepID=A0ABD3EGT3_9LAMI